MGSMGVVTVLIPLPVEYNPDEQGRRKSIEEGKFTETAEEIAQHFGGGAIHMSEKGNRIRGFWWDNGVIDQDALAIIEVDIPDDSASREWIMSYAKKVLLQRFEQKAIYIRIVPKVETWTVYKIE